MSNPPAGPLLFLLVAAVSGVEQAVGVCHVTLLPLLGFKRWAYSATNLVNFPRAP